MTASKHDSQGQRRFRDTYEGYAIGCAAVWAALLAIVSVTAGDETRRIWYRACHAWWVGWTSATIARFVYPPPKKWQS